MKKFKLLSMSFILSISAIAGLCGQSYAATYDISGGYLHSTTNIRSENRGNVVIGTTNNGNNNYGYGAAILGVGLDTGMYLVAPGGGTELSCTKQLDGYFIINFTNFLMLPLDSTTRSTVVGNGLIENGVKIMEGGLFYECSNKNNSNTKYPGIYGYIKRKYGDNEHEIRAGLNSSNKRATSSPLQLVYGNDYPNTYRTLSGTIYDSLMSGNITIEPRTMGLVGIENYQSIGGSINNPTYYVSNTQALKIYTKYSHSTDGKFVRLILTGYDRNGQVTIPNTIGGVQGLILSGTAANKISHSDGINLRTNVSVSVGPKDFGLYGYNSQNYSKLENLASGTITLKLGNDWTQSINFIVSGANCSGNDIQINPTGCYAGNKTVTISCITGNLHAQAYQRDNNGSRSSQNFYTVSANGQHNVKVKDLRGHETIYSFEITGIISNGGLTAPTNPSANPLTGNDTTPTLSWNASDDSTCNSGNTITYKVWVCENSTCSSAVRSGTTTNTSRDVTSALPNTAGKRYYFKIQAGNGHDSSSFSSVGTFFLDTTAPTIQITNPTAACKTGKTVSATATDAGGAGVASLQRVMTGSSTCTGTTTNNWTTYTNPINLSEADSGKYICFKAVDNAGNISFSKSNQITGIDLSGPIGTITIAKACYTGTTIPLQLSAQDVGCSTVKQMQFSCDGTNWSTAVTYTGTKSFALGSYASYGCTTADGDKTIYVRYKDNIGNRGNAVSTGVRVDTTPPTVTSFTTDIPVCSKGTTSGQITITRSETIGSNSFTISELTIKSGQARSARTTENNPTYIGYISYPVGNVLNYGSTTVTIGKKVVNDTCGNPNTTTGGISLEFDLAGPSKPTPTSGIGCMNTVTPTLTWTESNDVGCSNSIGGYEIQVCANNTCTNVKKTGSTTTTSWTVPSGLSNNTQYYRRVRAKDGLGNRGDWSDATGFKADTTGPTTTSSISPSNRSCTNQNVTVTLSGNDNGCNGNATTYYCIGSNACTPTTQGTTAQITASNGSTASGYVGFYSIDGFGNTGSTQHTNKISIDKAGPNTPTQGTNISCTGARPTLTWSAPSDVGCNNTISGYEIWICTDNACTSATKSGTSTTTSWKVPNGLTSGKYYWKVRAKDGLGNWGSFSSIWSFTIDTSAPAAPTVNDIKPLSCNNSTTVTVSGTTVQDVGCAGGVQYKFCMTTKATATNCTESSWSTTPTATFNNLKNGTTYNFFIKSKDGFGTESNWSTTYKSYTVDQIAPTTNIQLPNNWQCSPNDIAVSFTTKENGCNSSDTTYYCLKTNLLGGTLGINIGEGGGRLDGIGKGPEESACDRIGDYIIAERRIQLSTETGTANETTIYYYSTDGLNNTEQTQETGLVQIDKAGPTYTVQIEPGYECQKITATIGKPEDVGCAGIGSKAYSWDGGRTFTDENSYALGQNEVGTQVINVVVKDKFDNTTAQTVTYEWIDSPLKVESDTYVGSDNVGKETIKLDRYDLIHPKAGICETIKASVIGSKNNLGTCTINDSILIFEPRHDTTGDDVCILELTDGDTKVEVYVEFNRIDTVAPRCGTRTYKPTLTTCTSGSVTATLKDSTDIGRGIEIAGGSCNILEYNKTCKVTIQDKAGNTTVCTSAAATNIDVTPPTITTVTNANGYECDTITGSIVATDPKPRCGSLTYSWNGGSFGSATKYGLRQTTTGTQTIIVKVKDSAGNMTSTGVKYTRKDVVLTANDFSVNGVCGEMTVDRHKLSKAQAGSCETITATINTQGQKGKCEIDKDNITYIPNSNATGSDTCAIAITDGDTTKNITITWNDIDTLPPTLTMITNASGCVKGGKYTVTGTWSELVNGFEIKDITANIGTVGEDFTFAKNPTYAWFVTSPSSEYGKTEVNVDKNVVTDMCENNTNISSSSIEWEYDNAAPKVTVDTTKATVPECTVGTASITDVQQFGCAPEHPTPYSRDAGTTYGKNKIKTGYLGTSGHITYTLRVRDNLGNYAPKNITFKWTDTKPTINANTISYGTLTGTHTDNWFNTINLVTDMDVIDGACGTGTVTLKSVSNCSTNLIADAKTGANNIVQLKAIDQVEGRASCTVTFVDDEGSTVSGSISFYVDTKKPVCTRGEPTPAPSCISGGMAGTIQLTCTDGNSQTSQNGISQTSIAASNVNYASNRLTLSNSNTVAGTGTSKTFTFSYTGKTTTGIIASGFTLKANAIYDINNNGNAPTGPSSVVNVDNAGPTITFTDLSTNECVATTWVASATDIGCAGMSNKSNFMFSSTSFGNNRWGVGSLQITADQVRNVGEKVQNLTVKDNLGNTTTVEAILTINDVTPTFDVKHGGSDTVNIGNITGTHIGSGFITPDLIDLMKPIDGVCGSKPMSLVDVKCDGNIIKIYVIYGEYYDGTLHDDTDKNKVILIPNNKIETDSECNVIFQDDEGNKLTGTITFHVDTLNPTIKLQSDADGSCEKGGKARDVKGTWSEKVLGFIQSDITSTNGTIGLFTDKNPIFLWTVTSPTTSYGSTNIHIKDNVATDQLGNPNTEGSNELKWNYDNVGPSYDINMLINIYECSNNTATIANAKDVGCAGLHKLPYSRDGGKTYEEKNEHTIYRGSVGEEKITVRVRDSLDNYTDETITYKWLDYKLTAGDFVGHKMVGNVKRTADWKILSKAKAGDCETITATLKTNGTKGSCSISGDNITYSGYANKTGTDTCVITLTDGDTNKDIKVTWNNIDTMAPTFTVSDTSVQENQPLNISISATDQGTGVAAYKCGNSDRINTSGSGTCNMGTKPEPESGRITIQVRDKRGNTTSQSVNYSWTNVNPTANNVESSADECNSITLTAKESDPGGTTFSYQWYTDNKCSKAIDGEKNKTFKADAQGEPTTISYYYKVRDAQSAESNCATATANWKNVAPTAKDIQAQGNEGDPIELIAKADDPCGTTFTYQRYSDASCTKVINDATNETYRVEPASEPTTIKYSYKVRDKNAKGEVGLPSNCATATATWENLPPVGELSNNGPKPECTTLTYNMTGTDAGGGKLTYKLFEGNSCNGTVVRSGTKIESGTPKSRTKTINNKGTYTVSLSILDNQEEPSKCVSTIGEWKDTLPTFNGHNGVQNEPVRVGNITGAHLKQGFTTEDLIALMKPIDGDCGAGTITLVNVKCDEYIIAKANVNMDNTVTIIPLENIQFESSCTVTFQDDEGNPLDGRIKFYVDTLNPTINLTSNGSGSCKTGGTVRNMTGKRSEEVIGFTQSDITKTNLTIGGFMDKYNPIFTWTGTSPKTNNSWGTSTVVINTNVATDNLGNPNTKGSNTITRQYDNAGPTYDINNPTVAECTTGTARVTNVKQVGCAESVTKAYSRNVGSNRTSYTATSTYSLYRGSVGTQSGSVRVKDVLGNYTQKSSIFTWTNTTPTITTNNYSVGTLTGTHTGNRFNTTNLVTAMNVIDGACGNSTVTLKSVSNCSSTYIASSQTGANNIVQLKAKNGVEGTGTCTVTFVDDEGSTVAGTIKFYVDSKHPTVTLTSNGTNSCQKATTYTVTGTFTEAVQGVEQSDLSITNGLIKGFTFNNKTEKEAVRTVRSNESGYGWLSISIPANKFTDKYNNINIQASQGASGRNYDNACPTITFEDKKVDECTAIKREASAKDNGCAGLNDKDAYMFNKKTSFGNDEWGNNILNIVASQIPNAIGKEKEQIVTVRDTLGNQCDAIAKLIINNVAPTITTNNYSVGTLTGTHTGNWFNTTNLVTAMNVKDGNCGTGTVTLKSVSNCSSTYIASSQTGANNIVQLKAKNGVEGSGTCTVTFVDDEGTTVTGTIKFYVDSKHPTVTLTSNGTNSCQKATTYTVTGTFTEAVQGVEQSDLIVKSGSIQSFNIKSNNLAVRTVRSNESGYGWLSISIPSNRFTDMYNNINIQASLGASGRNFDNAAPEQPIIDRENSSSCIAGNKVTIVAQTVHDYGCASGVQYQFCKSTNNNTNDCKSINLSSRSASNSYQATNLSNNTPYYFFVRAKDGLNNQTEWSPAYGTIESLSAYDFTGYFNYEREEPGPYKVTVNRKRKSYASAGICENIQITNIDCKNGTSIISGDELIYETVDDIKTWVVLHQKAQNEELYCNLTISDGNTSKNIRASFQIKFDDIYLNPIIMTGDSVVDYSGTEVELSSDRTTKYTNKAGISLQINGGFISKEPERHRYRVSCDKKEWSEWKQYPSNYQGQFEWDLVKGDGKPLEGCNDTEGNRKVHIQLCDSPTKTLCTEKATRLGN